MKTIVLVPVIIFLFCTGSVQAGTPVWQDELIATAKLENSRDVKQQSILVRKHHTAAAAADDLDCCRDYKGKQIAGFIIMPVGLIFMAGGSYMAYVSANNIINEVTNAINVFPEKSKGIAERDIARIGWGVGMAVVGLALFPTGLAMGIRGTVKVKKFCGRSYGSLEYENYNYNNRRAFYVAPSAKGLGFTCSF